MGRGQGGGGRGGGGGSSRASDNREVNQQNVRDAASLAEGGTNRLRGYTDAEIFHAARGLRIGNLTPSYGLGTRARAIQNLEKEMNRRGM